MKIKEALKLIDTYGMHTTLLQLLQIVQGDRIYKCPKCFGEGFITEEYNAYPDGLPDSGSVYEAGYRKIHCNLCDGEGYTDKEFKPRMVQDGWEQK